MYGFAKYEKQHCGRFMGFLKKTTKEAAAAAIATLVCLATEE